MLLTIAIGAFVLALIGENMRSVFLAASLLCLMLPYFASHRLLNDLAHDPFTSHQIDTDDQ
jgi:hypothetical protein